MMALWKKIIAYSVTMFLNLSVFSQPGITSSALYDEGRVIADKNPSKAYPILVRSIDLARKNGDWGVYIEAVNFSSNLVLTALYLPNTPPLASKNDEAFNFAKEALALTEKFKSRAAVAALHYNVAEFYNLSYDIDTAVFHYKKAKDIFTALNGALSKEVAKCYHGLGDVYKYNKLDFYEAETNYEKALTIRERIEFQDTLVLYRNYYSLAATNRSQNDFEKGLSYGAKAMELAKSLDPMRVEATTAMVANIYRDMNESAMARKYYLEAIELNKKTNIKENRAWYYLCLGEAYKNDSLYSDASKCFSQAYPFYSSSNEKDRNLFLVLLLNMAQVYETVDDEARFFRTTREFFNELSKRNEKRGLFLSQGIVLLGDFHNARNRYDSALRHYQRALVSLLPQFKSLKIEDNPTEESIGFFYYTYDVLVRKASALTGKFSATNNPAYLKQSLACLRLAEKLLSNHRSTLDMEKSKREFLDAGYDLYEDILARVLEGEKLFPADTVSALAFRYLEQSKARSLADALAQAEQSRKISAKDSLFRIHTDLRRQLLAIQDQINYELEKSSSSTEISRLREEMVGVDRRIQNCKQAIEEKYPGYFNVKYGYSTPALKDVRQVLKDHNQAELEFFWGSEWVYALAITGDSVLFRRIGRPDSIRVTINEILKHFDESTSGLKAAAYESFVSSAYKLYKTLVQPFVLLIDNKERILIIPDGPISQVPFEVLLQEPKATGNVDYHSLKYLIKSYAIGYAYSSAMLMGKSVTPVRKPSLLAVGFTGGSRLRAPDPELEEIVGAEEELNALAKRFSQGKFLVGPDATEANFKTLSPQYDIIHLAIHGRGDVERSFSSSLYFRSKLDSLDDGELHDYELYGLKLKALMAVLSACESGLGKDYKGEGMISMASAFTYSGCGNILMSLWKVNDKASTVLMDDFYGRLLEGKTIDDALRQAKLDYLETSDELTSDPKIWAPLVVYGNLDRIFKESNESIVLYGALTLALLLGAIFLIRGRRLT
ncbi:MAG TPA: CHAT domain-containing tetratricopeptide repeat protein [Chryseolinea sp.]